MKTLIFPFVGKNAEAFARNAKERGDECWTDFTLPTIHDAAFAEAFTRTLEASGATHLFCPVASVHKFMETFPHGLVLLGESPIQQVMREHAELMERAEKLLTPDSGVSLIELAGVLKAAGNIYGESNDEKIAAMLRIFATAPDGDVVEVGSLCGRTAFVLRWCAIRYSHPFMLTVDPWSPVAGIQADSPPLLAAMTAEWDWDAVAEIFAVNMAPLGHSNHLRLTSEQAYPNYAQSAIPEEAQIAVLHIDGNHDYKAAKRDTDMWCKHIAPGGWLILDDYVWAHGDGPRRAGDELIAAWLNKYGCAEHFEAGGALFIRKA
jgi:hypothetical protein